MRVLEDPLGLARPDDHRVVRTARSEVLTVLSVVNRVNLVRARRAVRSVYTNRIGRDIDDVRYLLLCL